MHGTPLFTPDSDWKPPTELPDLRNRTHVAIDIENCDRGLEKKKGSGWPTMAGFVCGVAAAWDGGAIYVPVNHPSPDCFDGNQVSRWLIDLFKSEATIVMHHCQHDIGWLWAQWGIEPPLHIDDTEGMAALVDENRLKYGLDALCAWRGLPGKDESLLNEVCKHLGIKDPKGQMWDLPAKYVGPYAEQDARSTLALSQDLRRVLLEENTYAAYQTEMAIVPMIHRMRRQGVRVDLDAANRAKAELLRRRDAVFGELSQLIGESVGMEEIGRNRWLTRVFDKHGIQYPLTEKGNPSFTGGLLGWMGKHSNKIPKLIAQADRYNNAATKFVENYIESYAVNGRLHSTVNQYRGEEGGARTMRFSYSNPPLQQMSGRDPEIASLIRSCFLPEEGTRWMKADYSEQEYRLIVHYSELLKLEGGAEAAERYRTEPTTKFHNYVVEMTGLDYSQAKNTNFAKAYRAGPKKFAEMINKSLDEATEIYRQYDKELPFVYELGRLCQHQAENKGFLKLIDGARLHFDRWESTKRGLLLATTEEKAREWSGQNDNKPIRRAFCYAAMNGLIQGSAARQIKLAMLGCWKEGLVPMLQLHDELDFSIDAPDKGKKIIEIMCDAVQLNVPVRVDAKYGSNWLDAKHEWLCHREGGDCVRQGSGLAMVRC
jgi:DNA polymerase I-like protein with 3'-5' exonuclease and polymerase domains